MKWVEMLLECQESCIINEGNTTKYFKFQKEARQGDPFSIYLFILCVELVFILFKANKRVKGINIFEHTHLYSAYADDTTFFLRGKRSIKELLNTFATCSKYSGLKPNHEKCKIISIGVLKNVKVAVCGMNSLFVQKGKEKGKKFLETITKIQNVSKVWQMCRLALEAIKSPYKILSELGKNTKNFSVAF